MFTDNKQIPEQSLDIERNPSDLSRLYANYDVFENAIICNGQRDM